MEIKRLFDCIDHQLKHFPKPDMFSAKVNGEWKSYSTEAVKNIVDTFSEGLIELENKIVLEIGGYSSTVFGGITDDSFFVGKNFYIRSFIKCINHEEGAIGFGKGEPKLCSSFGGRDFCSYIIIGQVHTVIIRRYGFSFMGEPTGSFILIKDQ